MTDLFESLHQGLGCVLYRGRGVFPLQIGEHHTAFLLRIQEETYPANAVLEVSGGIPEDKITQFHGFLFSPANNVRRIFAADVCRFDISPDQIPDSGGSPAPGSPPTENWPAGGSQAEGPGETPARAGHPPDFCRAGSGGTHILRATLPRPGQKERPVTGRLPAAAGFRPVVIQPGHP